MNTLKRLFIFSILTIIALSIPASVRSDLQSAVERSIQVRPASAAEALQRRDGGLEPKQIEVEAAEGILGDLQDYSFNNDLEQSIRYFLESNFHQQVNSLHCVNPSRVPLQESIFIDYEHQQVVKVFPLARRLHQIPRTLSGMVALQQLDLEESVSIRPLAIGKCTVNEDRFCLVVMDLAPGKEIKKILDDVMTESHPEAMRRALQAMTKLGLAIGEMHVKSARQAGENDSFDELFTAPLKRKIEGHLMAFREKNHPDVPFLEAFFEQKLKELDKERFSLAVLHGDTHLLNFLYDAESDIVSIIDNPLTHLSVDRQGHAIGACHIYDMARIEDDLVKVLLIHDECDVLAQELTAAFHNAYCSKVNDLFVQSHYDLCVALTRLRRWHFALNWEEEKDSERREQLQRLYSYCRSYFFSE